MCVIFHEEAEFIIESDVDYGKKSLPCNHMSLKGSTVFLLQAVQVASFRGH